MNWDSLSWKKIITRSIRDMNEDPQLLAFIYLTDHLPADIEENTTVKAVSDKMVLLKTKIGEKTYINTDHILYVDVKLG